MEKISHQQVKALLKQAGASIRTLTKENTNLQEKVAFYEREDRIRSIASQMEEKHLNDDLDHNEKLAALRKVPNLVVTEEAVKMASPQGFRLGAPGDKDNAGPADDSRAAIETFLVTGDMPE